MTSRLLTLAAVVFAGEDASTAGARRGEDAGQ